MDTGSRCGNWHNIMPCAGACLTLFWFSVWKEVNCGLFWHRHRAFSWRRSGVIHWLFDWNIMMSDTNPSKEDKAKDWLISYHLQWHWQSQHPKPSSRASPNGFIMPAILSKWRSPSPVLPHLSLWQVSAKCSCNTGKVEPLPTPPVAGALCCDTRELCFQYNLYIHVSGCRQCTAGLRLYGNQP